MIDRQANSDSSESEVLQIRLSELIGNNAPTADITAHLGILNGMADFAKKRLETKNAPSMKRLISPLIVEF
jgi:hypothetical protein